MHVWADTCRISGLMLYHWGPAACLVVYRLQIYTSVSWCVATCNGKYRRSGYFCVKKLSYDKFLCKKFFVGMTLYRVSVASMDPFLLSYIPWCSFANVSNRSSSIFAIAPRSTLQVGGPYRSTLYFFRIHSFSASLKHESSLFGHFSLIVSLVPIGRWRNRQSSSQREARLLHSQVTSLQSSSSIGNVQCYGIHLIIMCITKYVWLHCLPRVELSMVERIFPVFLSDRE